MGLVAHNSAPSSDEQAVLAPTKPYREFLFRARFFIQSVGLVSTVLVSMLKISIMIAGFICPYIWTPSLRLFTFFKNSHPAARAISALFLNLKNKGDQSNVRCAWPFDDSSMGSNCLQYRVTKKIAKCRYVALVKYERPRNVLREREVMCSSTLVGHAVYSLELFSSKYFAADNQKSFRHVRG